VTPGNILLLGDDRPLLLGPGLAGREIGSDLIETLMASVATPGAAPPPAAPSGAVPTRAIADLYALADVTRFCITGVLPATGVVREPETMAALIARSFEPAARPRYSPELLGTLDAALSPYAEDWPLSAGQFRSWLVRGAPPTRLQTAAPPAPMPSTRTDATHGAAAPLAPMRDAMPGPDAPPRARDAAMPSHHEPAQSQAPHRAPPLREPPSFDSMLTDRAPWVAPPLMAARRRRRRLKLAMGGVLTLLAVGVLAVVSGAWEHVPTIALDRVPNIVVERATEMLKPDPAPAPNAGAVPAPNPSTAATPTPPVATLPVPASVPGPIPNDATAPRAEAAAPAPAQALPASMPAPTPTAAASLPPPPEPAPANAGVPAQVADVTPASESATVPATPPAPSAAPVAPTAEERPAPPRRVAPTAEDRSAPPRRAAPAPTRQAAAPDPDPRAACSGKSEFAMYRCMQQQCESNRWYAHPQCIRLRAPDRVD